MWGLRNRFYGVGETGGGWYFSRTGSQRYFSNFSEYLFYFVQEPHIVLKQTLWLLVYELSCRLQIFPFLNRLCLQHFHTRLNALPVFGHCRFCWLWTVELLCQNVAECAVVDAHDGIDGSFTIVSDYDLWLPDHGIEDSDDSNFLYT